MVGARRSDGACGTDPRRVESGEPIGGALRFSRSSTSTHSVGRALVFEPGTFEAAPQSIEWYGDDHSRLVLVDTPLPIAGGRISSGSWAEFPWGTQNLADGVLFIGAPLAQGISTVRSVDIGLCSQHERWTNAANCGIADRLTTLADTLVAPFDIPGPVFPGLECFRFGLNGSGIAGAARSDRFCATASLRLSSVLDCFVSSVGFPVFAGCTYDRVDVSMCGDFGTRPASGGFRDLVFNLREFDLVPVGSQRPTDDFRFCGGPADLGLYLDIVRNEIRDAIVGGLNDGLAAASVRREFSVDPPAPPGSCSGPLGTYVLNSGCATPSAGLTPDQDCMAFVAGDPSFTGIRARCEARRTTVACAVDSDCGGETRTLRRCDLRRRCQGLQGLGAECTSSANCGNQESCVVVSGTCVDSEPVCYWNIEADRVEMLPSGLQIVLAEDEADPTYTAFSRLAGAGIVGVLENQGVCRGDTLPIYSGADATGVLGFAP